MKHPLSAIAWLLTFFTTAQLIGLFIVTQALVPVMTRTVEPTGFLYIIGGMLIGTILALVMIKFSKFKLIKTWVSFGIFIGLFISLSVVLPILLALILSIGLVLWRLLRPNFFSHNIPELFIYSGFTLIFLELVTIPTAILLLLIVSVYDMIAVWKTKHMITLAKGFVESKNFTGFSFNYAKKKTQFHQAILGGGDIFFPLLFASVVLLEKTLLSSILVMIGALVGLMVLFAFSKPKRAYPAMPFITAGALLGFGLSVLFV